MAESSFFKCILVGDCFSGKTTFVNQFISDEGKSRPSVSKFCCPITFSTNVGIVSFNVFDTDGQEAFGGLRDSFFQKSDCAIIMFDVTSPASFDNVPFWHRKVKSLNGNIPVVLCGNKIDIKARKLKTHEIVANYATKHLKYFETSGKSKLNINSPFFYLIERLVKKGPVTDFTIIASEVSVDISSLHKLIEEAKMKNSKDESETLFDLSTVFTSA